MITPIFQGVYCMGYAFVTGDLLMVYSKEGPNKFKIKSNNLAITKQIEEIFIIFVPQYLPKHENKSV